MWVFFRNIKADKPELSDVHTGELAVLEPPKNLFAHIKMLLTSNSGHLDISKFFRKNQKPVQGDWIEWVEREKQIRKTMRRYVVGIATSITFIAATSVMAPTSLGWSMPVIAGTVCWATFTGIMFFFQRLSASYAGVSIKLSLIGKKMDMDISRNNGAYEIYLKNDALKSVDKEDIEKVLSSNTNTHGVISIADAQEGKGYKLVFMPNKHLNFESVAEIFQLIKGVVDHNSADLEGVREEAKALFFNRLSSDPQKLVFHANFKKEVEKACKVESKIVYNIFVWLNKRYKYVDHVEPRRNKALITKAEKKSLMKVWNQYKKQRNDALLIQHAYERVQRYLTNNESKVVEQMRVSHFINYTGLDREFINNLERLGLVTLLNAKDVNGNDVEVMKKNVIHKNPTDISRIKEWKEKEDAEFLFLMHQAVYSPLTDQEAQELIQVFGESIVWEKLFLRTKDNKLIFRSDYEEIYDIVKSELTGNQKNFLSQQRKKQSRPETQLKKAETIWNREIYYQQIPEKERPVALIEYTSTYGNPTDALFKTFTSIIEQLKIHPLLQKVLLNNDSRNSCYGYRTLGRIIELRRINARMKQYIKIMHEAGIDQSMKADIDILAMDLALGREIELVSGDLITETIQEAFGDDVARADEMYNVLRQIGVVNTEEAGVYEKIAENVDNIRAGMKKRGTVFINGKDDFARFFEVLTKRNIELTNRNIIAKIMGAFHATGSGIKQVGFRKESLENKCPEIVGRIEEFFNVSGKSKNVLEIKDNTIELLSSSDLPDKTKKVLIKICEKYQPSIELKKALLEKYNLSPRQIQQLLSLIEQEYAETEETVQRVIAREVEYRDGDEKRIIDSMAVNTLIDVPLELYEKCLLMSLYPNQYVHSSPAYRNETGMMEELIFNKWALAKDGRFPPLNPRPENGGLSATIQQRLALLGVIGLMDDTKQFADQLEAYIMPLVEKKFIEDFNDQVSNASARSKSGLAKHQSQAYWNEKLASLIKDLQNEPRFVPATVDENFFKTRFPKKADEIYKKLNDAGFISENVIQKKILDRDSFMELFLKDLGKDADQVYKWFFGIYSLKDQIIEVVEKSLIESRDAQVLAAEGMIIWYTSFAREMDHFKNIDHKKIRESNPLWDVMDHDLRKLNEVIQNPINAFEDAAYQVSLVEIKDVKMYDKVGGMDFLARGKLGIQRKDIIEWEAQRRQREPEYNIVKYFDDLNEDNGVLAFKKDAEKQIQNDILANTLLRSDGEKLLELMHVVEDCNLVQNIIKIEVGISTTGDKPIGFDTIRSDIDRIIDARIFKKRNLREGDAYFVSEKDLLGKKTVKPLGKKNPISKLLTPINEERRQLLFSSQINFKGPYSERSDRRAAQKRGVTQERRDYAMHLKKYADRYISQMHLKEKLRYGMTAYLETECKISNQPMAYMMVDQILDNGVYLEQFLRGETVALNENKFLWDFYNNQYHEDKERLGDKVKAKKLDRGNKDINSGEYDILVNEGIVNNGRVGDSIHRNLVQKELPSIDLQLFFTNANSTERGLVPRSNIMELINNDLLMSDQQKKVFRNMLSQKEFLYTQEEFIMKYSTRFASDDRARAVYKVLAEYARYPEDFAQGDKHNDRSFRDLIVGFYNEVSLARKDYIEENKQKIISLDESEIPIDIFLYHRNTPDTAKKHKPQNTNFMMYGNYIRSKQRSYIQDLLDMKNSWEFVKELNGRKPGTYLETFEFRQKLLKRIDVAGDNTYIFERGIKYDYAAEIKAWIAAADELASISGKAEVTFEELVEYLREKLSATRGREYRIISSTHEVLGVIDGAQFLAIAYNKDNVRRMIGAEYATNADKDNWFYNFSLKDIKRVWHFDPINGKPRDNKQIILAQGNQDLSNGNDNKLQKNQTFTMTFWNSFISYKMSENILVKGWRGFKVLFGKKMPPTGCGGWRYRKGYVEGCTRTIVEDKIKSTEEVLSLLINPSLQKKYRENWFVKGLKAPVGDKEKNDRAKDIFTRIAEIYKNELAEAKTNKELPIVFARNVLSAFIKELIVSVTKISWWSATNFTGVAAIAIFVLAPGLSLSVLFSFVVGEAVGAWVIALALWFGLFWPINALRGLSSNVSRLLIKKDVRDAISLKIGALTKPIVESDGGKKIIKVVSAVNNIAIRNLVGWAFKTFIERPYKYFFFSKVEDKNQWFRSRIAAFALVFKNMLPMAVCSTLSYQLLISGIGFLSATPLAVVVSIIFAAWAWYFGLPLPLIGRISGKRLGGFLTRTAVVLAENLGWGENLRMLFRKISAKYLKGDISDFEPSAVEDAATLNSVLSGGKESILIPAPIFRAPAEGNLLTKVLQSLRWYGSQVELIFKEWADVPHNAKAFRSEYDKVYGGMVDHGFFHGWFEAMEFAWHKSVEHAYPLLGIASYIADFLLTTFMVVGFGYLMFFGSMTLVSVYTILGFAGVYLCTMGALHKSATIVGVSEPEARIAEDMESITTSKLAPTVVLVSTMRLILDFNPTEPIEQHQSVLPNRDAKACKVEMEELMNHQIRWNFTYFSEALTRIRKALGLRDRNQNRVWPIKLLILYIDALRNLVRAPDKRDESKKDNGPNSRAARLFAIPALVSLGVMVIYSVSVFLAPAITFTTILSLLGVNFWCFRIFSKNAKALFLIDAIPGVDPYKTDSRSFTDPDAQIEMNNIEKFKGDLQKVFSEAA